MRYPRRFARGKPLVRGQHTRIEARRVQRGERRRKPGTSGSRPRADGGRGQGDLFGLDGNRPDVTDFYEDEVFNVNNLPSANDYPFEDK